MSDGESYCPYWKAFWTCVEQSTNARVLRTGTKSSRAQNWITVVRTGIGSVHFTAVASKRYRRIDADFTIENKEIACELFAELKERRHDIESAFGRELKWKRIEQSTNNKHRIYLPKHGVFVDERGEWQPQHEWLIEHLERLHRAIICTGVLDDWRSRSRKR